MKMHVVQSQEKYMALVESGTVMPGDRILITLGPFTKMYTEVARHPFDGSTRAQRRALKRENVDLVCQTQGMPRRKRRAFARQAANQMTPYFPLTDLKEPMA